MRKREKERGIEPDPEIDAFMKANAIEGKREGIETDYVLHVLGLSICADTLVSNSLCALAAHLQSFGRHKTGCWLEERVRTLVSQVGNQMIRGISGGQKKRVTTAEMIAGPKKTLFMVCSPSARLFSVECTSDWWEADCSASFH